MYVLISHTSDHLMSDKKLSKQQESYDYTAYTVQLLNVS